MNISRTNDHCPAYSAATVQSLHEARDEFAAGERYPSVAAALAAMDDIAAKGQSAAKY